MVDGRRQKAAHRMPYTWTNPLGGSPGRFKCLPNLSLLEELETKIFVRLCVTPQMAAHQPPRPWDSPGKNTGVGC